MPHIPVRHFLLYLYISRQSKSPLSNASIMISAVARLVAIGILCMSQRRMTSFTSGSCGFGFCGSRRKIRASIPFCAICAPSCCLPPSGPAIFVNRKISNFFDQPAGCTGRIQLMLAQNPTICNTEILHQCFLRVMRNKSDIHFLSSFY
mgnify:CR=1 FL=1